MPIETTRTTTIAVPRDTVWATLADFGGLARWGRGIDHSTMLTPPRPDDPTLRVGDRRRVQIGRAALVETVIEREEAPGLTIPDDDQESFRARDYAAAAEAFRSAVAARPDAVDSWFRLGLALSADGAADEAIATTSPTAASAPTPSTARTM